ATWYASNSGVYTEEPRNYAVLVTSGDGGNSWSEPPNLVVQHPVETIASKDPCPWIDPLGRLWFFWTQYDGLMSSSTSWAVTADNPEEENPEWSEPRQIGEGLLLNKPAVLSTGEWIFCSSRGGTPVNIYISTDKGKTISHYSQADVPGAGWNEHMVIEKKDGSLWMLVRTNRGIGQTFSHDRGRTWTQGELYRPGPSTRFHIRRLKSGRLLLITHPVEENTRRRASMTAYLSEDEGNSWPYELLLDGRDSVSYPDAVETADGVIYSVHDHSRAGKMQIILSVFTEEDIMAGKLVVKNSRLGVKISGKD
ncbi:MAG TPA: sialidase family protein, partial [bacterium]|nr:sialidase family protein [bacterium]